MGENGGDLGIAELTLLDAAEEINGEEVRPP